MSWMSVKEFHGGHNRGHVLNMEDPDIDVSARQCIHPHIPLLTRSVVQMGPNFRGKKVNVD